ncbi:hypothetical protein PC9H_007480 [Pleurotus ostreatus]|uniref:Transglycosylase SLT domain-containing protein n=2 Tax=Pleurotus ostreatus TaxID=5322 RepID=A0A8H6ZTH9_PLEOS|nr:uncharacterized protein PC9H_007480 [Pleurotus ostreatus]KAF7428259.1 hypothetical protein PC9H_007480 [Pleurotus ostreatus]KAJ8696351.1 hypothetical protein PTI98_006229 [Pleurotus ostreatus]
MKVSTVLFAVFSTACAVSAIQPHNGGSDLTARHLRLSRRAVIPGLNKTRRSTSRRCKPRPKKSDNALVAPTSSGPPPEPKKKEVSSSSGSGAGLLQVQSSCGDIGATKETTNESGPNGHINWLNCGMESGGWNPQFVRVEDIKTVDLNQALQDPGSPYQACQPFVPIFQKYGGQFGIPPIMLAAFAMQESSCNAETTGGGGEQGLMQITQEKCGGAPGGNCKDPDFNIRTAAKFFADTLNRNNGDLLKSLGAYNGWFPSMTAAQAKEAAHSGCCRCQKNMDYLHQFLNGWLQNKNAYDNTLRLGKFFNLDICLNL